MTRITLKPLDDGQKSVEIPVGKTTIGRGPFLGCGDKKVSRNHAVLEVTDQGEVYLTPTHVNPCFFQPTADSPGTILKKDKPHKLENGDSFSLLPRAFRYKLIVDNDNTESDIGKSKESADTTPEDKVNGMVEEKVEASAPDAKVHDVQPSKDAKVNGARACQPKEKEITSAAEECPVVKEQDKNSSSAEEKPNIEVNGSDSQEQAKPVEKESEIQEEATQEDANEEETKGEEEQSELKVSKEEIDDDDDSSSRSRRTLPDWLAESSVPENEEKKRPKTTKQHHREKVSAKRKTETNVTEKRKKRAERRKESDTEERVEHPQRQSAVRSSRTNRQTRQGLSLEDFVASDDDEWQSDNSEPRHKKRRRSKRKDDDSGSDWEMEHKKSRKISHKYSSGSESGSDWGASSHKKKKAPKTRRRRSKRVNECDVISDEEEEEKSQSSKPEKRVPCQYGKKCYRKNPSHVDQFSHPGDSDYESPADEGEENVSASEESNDLPECPYGTSCFRKNPQHKKEYKHTKKVRPQREAAKQAGKKTTVTRENDEPDNYDLNDSLVNDDSDEYKPADSGSDFDSSQETSNPAKGSKRPTKNKRAKRL